MRDFCLILASFAADRELRTSHSYKISWSPANMNSRSDVHLREAVVRDEGPVTHIQAALDDAAGVEKLEVDILLRAKALDSKHLHDLLSQGRASATRELACEIYRLHSLIRRAALLVNTIHQRTGKDALDITSQVLLAGLDQALKDEPAVTEARTWATCLRRGSGEAVLPTITASPAVEISVLSTVAE